MLVLDASHGEGGGQILRTALALSAVLGHPVELSRIRIRRPKPGLEPQHLAVVHALAAISHARVQGGALDATELHFSPVLLREATYSFDIGGVRSSAGAVSLVFQALLSCPMIFSKIGGTM